MGELVGGGAGVGGVLVVYHTGTDARVRWKRGGKGEEGHPRGQ